MTFKDFIIKEREIKVPKNVYIWDIVNATMMGRYRTKTEGRFIDRCLQKNSFVTDILDVGGGSGRFAIRLYERGFNVVVIERDILPIHILNKRKEEIGTILADGTKLPVGDSTFDCILAMGVLAHVNDCFFAECHRILRKKGIFIFAIANPKSWVLILQRYLEKQGYGQYYKYPYMRTVTDIKTQLLENGFKIEYARGYRWIPAGRVSNNKFIPLFEFLEWFFCLRFLKRLSPDILIMGRKK